MMKNGFNQITKLARQHPTVTIISLSLAVIISMSFVRALDLSLLRSLRIFMLPDWLHFTHGLLLIFPLVLLLMLVFHPARKRWFAMTLGALLILFAAEGGIRIYVASQPDRVHTNALFIDDDTSPYYSQLYQPHPYSLFMPKPDLSLASGLRHNHQGFRNSQDYGEKGNKFRIVFLGGSSTYSPAIADNNKIYSTLLEQTLNKQFDEQAGNRQFEVINAGLVTGTTAESLSRLIFFVSELEPDLIVISHGFTEVWARAFGGTVRSDYSNYRKRWNIPEFNQMYRNKPLTARITMWSLNHLEEYSLLARWFAEAVGIPSFAVLQMTNKTNRGNYMVGVKKNDNIGYFLRNTRFMIAIARSMGAKVVLVTDPVAPSIGNRGIYGQEVPKHNEGIRKLAAQEQVLLADLDEPLRSHPELFFKQKHLTEAGERWKSDWFANFFRQHNLLQ